jgi:hypothetical protein
MSELQLIEKVFNLGVIYEENRFRLNASSQEKANEAYDEYVRLRSIAYYRDLNGDTAKEPL